MTISPSTQKLLELECRHKPNETCPKVTKVTATLGNLRATLQQVEKLQAAGRLPEDGRVTVMTDREAQEIIRQVNSLPDKPDCSNLGFAGALFRRGLEELGVTKKVKGKIFKEIGKKHGDKVMWATGLAFYSPDELAGKYAKKQIKSIIPTQVAKAGLYLSILKDVENVALGAMDAYWDHSRRCTLHQAAIGLPKAMAKEVIGTVEYATSSPAQTPKTNSTPSSTTVKPAAPSVQKPLAPSSSTQPSARPAPASSVPAAQPSVQPQKPIQLVPEKPRSMPASSSSQPDPVDIFPETFSPDVIRAADKVLEYLGDSLVDATGVPAAIEDIRNFKNMICLIIENPVDAPKLIANRLIARPEAILNAFVESPKTALANIERFAATPGFEEAFGVVTGTLAVVSVVNAVLPLIQLLDKALQNPVTAPVTIVKELVHMGIGSVNAVFKLGKDLVRDPIGTGKQLFKSIVKAPVHAVKRIEKGVKHQLLGKTKKKKVAPYPIVAVPLDPQIFVRQFVHAATDCFIIAKGKWMVLEEKPFNTYLLHLYQDWKAAQAKRMFVGDLISFVGAVQNELLTENIAAIRRLTPTTHTSETMAPWVVVKSHVDVRLASAGLETVIAKRESEVKQLAAATAQLKQAGDALDASNKAMTQLLDTKQDAIRAALLARKRAQQGAK